MNRASPVELRQSLEMANALASSGIRFVPIPVMNEDGFNRLMDETRKILDDMLAEVEHDATNQQLESLGNHKHHFINGTCVECLKSE